MKYIMKQYLIAKLQELSEVISIRTKTDELPVELLWLRNETLGGFINLTNI